MTDRQIDRMIAFAKSLNQPLTEEDRLEDRKRWAVKMYEHYIATCTPDQMEAVKAREWKEPDCRCQYMADGFKDLEGNYIDPLKCCKC